MIEWLTRTTVKIKFHISLTNQLATINFADLNISIEKRIICQKSDHLSFVSIATKVPVFPHQNCSTSSFYISSISILEINIIIYRSLKINYFELLNTSQASGKIMNSLTIPTDDHWLIGSVSCAKSQNSIWGRSYCCRNSWSSCCCFRAWKAITRTSSWAILLNKCEILVGIR